MIFSPLETDKRTELLYNSANGIRQITQDEAENDPSHPQTSLSSAPQRSMAWKNFCHPLWNAAISYWVLWRGGRSVEICPQFLDYGSSESLILTVAVAAETNDRGKLGHLQTWLNRVVSVGVRQITHGSQDATFFFLRSQLVEFENDCQK